MGAGGGGRRVGLILIGLIFVVLVIGGAVVAFVLFTSGQSTTDGGGDILLSDGQGEVPIEELTPTPPPTILIIVAARDIQRGTALTPQDVTTLAWPDLPNAPVPTDALIVSQEEGGLGLEQVDGRIARVDILNGQPVQNFMLTPGDEPTDLGDTGSDAALLIPSGSVAISVPVLNKYGFVAYALRPGDHVDLMTSFLFVDVEEDWQTALPNLGILIDSNPEFPLNQFQFDLGRWEPGPEGATLIIAPNENAQRPRVATQLIIDNAIVLRVGDFPVEDINQPIVITPLPPPTVDPEAEAAAEEGGEPAEEEATPTPTPIPPPNSLTLIMSRQDALVLNYVGATGGLVSLALRSSRDDDVASVATDTVTLEYIFNFYGVDIPPRLPISHEPRVTTFQTLLLDEAPPPPIEGEAPPE